MRALAITPTHPPTPGKDALGVYLRQGVFIRALADLGAEIEILHLVPPDIVAAHPDRKALSEMQSVFWGTPVKAVVAERRAARDGFWGHYGAGLFSCYGQPHFYPYAGERQVAAVQSLLETKRDLLMVFGLSCMCPVLQLRGPVPPTFLDFDNVEHRMLARYVFSPPVWPGKLLYGLHEPALIRAELRAARRAVNTFVCSSLDSRHLQRLGAGKGVVAIANGIRMPAEIPPPARERTILYVGGYDYQPNLEAAEILINRVFPLVRRSLPDARLIMAGPHPHCIPSYAAAPEGVEFTGFVKDLATVYARAAMICCPIINGGGTRLKLIEAAAYGKPIVSTAIGAEGLEFEREKEILIREKDADLAEACLRILTDGGFSEGLGAAARRKAEALYDAARIQADVAALMRNALAAGR